MTVRAVIEVDASDAFHACLALQIAVRRLPGVWDQEQRDALGRVAMALRDASAGAT